MRRERPAPVIDEETRRREEQEKLIQKEIEEGIREPTSGLRYGLHKPAEEDQGSKNDGAAASAGDE